jgi:hypothetical protein
MSKLKDKQSDNKDDKKKKWSDHVTFIKEKGGVEDILIMDRYSTQIWASTTGFQLTQYTSTVEKDDGTKEEEEINEITYIMALMATDDLTSLPVHGLRLNKGPKMQILRSYIDNYRSQSSRVVFAKSSFGGCCLVCCKSAIIIGTYEERNGHTSSDCNETVIQYGRYLDCVLWHDGTLGGSGGIDELIKKDSSELSKEKKSETRKERMWKDLASLLCPSKGSQLTQFAAISKEGDILGYGPDDFELKGNEVVEVVKTFENKNTDEDRESEKTLTIQGTKHIFTTSFTDIDIDCRCYNFKCVTGGCCIVFVGEIYMLAVYNHDDGHTGSSCQHQMLDVAKSYRNNITLE